VPTTDKPRLLSHLARLIADAKQAGAPLETRMCQAYLAILGGDGAAVTMAYTHAQRVTLCCTDDSSAQLEDLQDVLQEGPGQDAYRSGEVKVADLGAETSPWPLFADAARKAVGAVQVCALPMQPNRQVIGVLTVYHRHRGAAVDHDDARFLSDAIGAVLVHASTGIDDLRTGPWATRAGIHQATGMVVEQLHVAPADALALLRAHAYTHDSSLAEVADRIVQRRLAFTDQDAGSENR
jgi:hypothetical protein